MNCEVWRVAIASLDAESDYFKLHIHAPIKGYSGWGVWGGVLLFVLVFVCGVFWCVCLFVCCPGEIVLNRESCFIDKVNIMLEIVRHNYKSTDASSHCCNLCTNLPPLLSNQAYTLFQCTQTLHSMYLSNLKPQSFSIPGTLT